MDEAYKIQQLLGERLNPLESYYYMTLGNAEALSLADKIGTLDPGTDADLVILNAAATPAMALKMEVVKTLAEELLRCCRPWGTIGRSSKPMLQEKPRNRSCSKAIQILRIVIEKAESHDRAAYHCRTEEARQTARPQDVLPVCRFRFVDRVHLRCERSRFQRSNCANASSSTWPTARWKLRMIGQTVSMPVALAPTGLTGMQHADGEMLAARAAEEFGIPFTLSTMSICSIEDVASVTKQPFWFQLYVMKDRDFVDKPHQPRKSRKMLGFGADSRPADPWPATQGDLRNGLHGAAKTHPRNICGRWRCGRAGAWT